MEVTCKVVDTEVRPVLFGFQNSIPCKEELKDASYGVYESKDNKSNIAIRVKGERLTLSGSGTVNPKNEKLFLGVYNSSKGVVKMIQTTNIIPLVQKVDGFEPKVSDADGDSIDYIKRRKMLVDVFGNKKSKQILRQRENARIETNSVIGGKAMEAILKIKGENAGDMSVVVMKKPKKTSKRAASSKKEGKEPKAKKGKKN